MRSCHFTTAPSHPTHHCGAAYTSIAHSVPHYTALGNIQFHRHQDQSVPWGWVPTIALPGQLLKEILFRGIQDLADEVNKALALRNASRRVFQAVSIGLSLTLSE